MRLFTLLAGLLATIVTYAQDTIAFRTGPNMAAQILGVNQIDFTYRKSDNPDGPVYTAPLRDVLFIKYANGTKDLFGNQGSSNDSTAKLRTHEAPVPGVAELRLAAGLYRFDKLHYQRGWVKPYFLGPGGQRIGMRDAESMMQGEPDAHQAFARGQSLRTLSLITGGSGILLIGVGAGVSLAGQLAQNGPMNRPGRYRHRNSTQSYWDGRNAEVGAVLAGGGVVFGIAAIWLGHRATVHFRRAAIQYNGRPAASLQFAPSNQGLGGRLLFQF